jgi:hypothetical protein
MKIDLKHNVTHLAFAGVLLGAVVGTAQGTREPASPAPARAVASAPTVTEVAHQAASAVIEGVGARSSVTEMRVERALAALAPRTRRLSDEDALRTAFTAYYRYQAANPEKVKKPYLYFVDYGQGSRAKRGYVFDMKALEVVEGPFTVAHGRGSDPQDRGMASRFSNRNGSAATSLGLYLTQETYAFGGKTGGVVYRSIGLRLKGLSGRFNGLARARGVVVHGAPYVTASRAGRSEGCPAMEPARARRLIPRIAGGALVFLYSPRGDDWLRTDRWVS